MQKRIQHLRVIDIVKHHRAPLGGNSTGEATTDRNSHALLHFFFDPHRRTGNELIRLLVEQEHGARFHLQQVPGTLEQSRKQLLEIEMSKSSIRQRL
jgi:hypothetical protein